MRVGLVDQDPDVHKGVRQVREGTRKMVKLPVHLIFHIAPAALTRQNPALILYPDTTVKIFRTAAPYARVTQPVYLKNSTNFTLSDFSIFNITTNEGIIYVQNFLKLRNSPEFLRLNVSWIRDNHREMDEIQVRIVNEPNKTCGGMSDARNWTFCSEYATSNECLKPSSCAISTGGAPSVETRTGPERCMWRGDKISSNITHLYSTCTPDRKTCPDAICDSLEQLHRLICPQDCTLKMMWPARRNPKTGRGIDEASGVVTCDYLESCTITIPKRRKPKTTSTVPPPLVQPNVSSLTGNYTTIPKFLGVDMAKCGTLCILGIVGGTLFLGSAVALVVICWRLDRVNKAVREKNNEEHHEMTAPLSISVTRNLTSEPLPLNFQMSLLSEEMAALNIIKKYGPDPKWEFPRTQLIIEQTLGEGEFGRVLRAKAMNIAGQTGWYQDYHPPDL
ncbi:hypothetical protein NQ315_005150 [Exocentrus adspersus]|uniref:RET cysteine rich domain-containing protein n=1 Tax=Exocentrus adspersus TaxID=1586481 RepID=A0AAV8VTG5_9CUCU|nr:hypothetical protein NQ315_005150 [Exocentrus adspersus]